MDETASPRSFARRTIEILGEALLELTTPHIDVSIAPLDVDTS